jgi:hypothetical protein
MHNLTVTQNLTVNGNAEGAAGGLALVGSDMGVVSSVTGAVGSVTGAVGSVTGAVGSVTGNVGGNVIGSVGSVVATVSANVVGFIATALSETVPGYIAAAFKKFFNLVSPTSTMNEITLVDTTTNLTNAGADTPGTTTLLKSGTTVGANFIFSVPALANAPSGGGGGGGNIVFTGANSVTITVVDGSANPIPSALVRITLASQTQLQQTNASGIAQTSAGVLPALDDGDYTLAVTAGFGYVGTTQTFTVDGTHTTATVVLQAQTIAVPAANQCTGTILTVDANGNPQPGETITIQLADDLAAGLAGDATPHTYTSDGDGQVTDVFLADTRYAIRRGSANITYFVTPGPGIPFTWPGVIG